MGVRSGSPPEPGVALAALGIGAYLATREDDEEEA